MMVLIWAVGVGLVLFIGIGAVRRLIRFGRENPRLMRCQLINAGLWVVAIGSLSGCFETYRKLVGEHVNVHPVLNVVFGAVELALLVGSCLALGYFMYREDDRSGKLRRRMPLYDRFLGKEA